MTVVLPILEQQRQEELRLNLLAFERSELMRLDCIVERGFKVDSARYAK